MNNFKQNVVTFNANCKLQYSKLNNMSHSIERSLIPHEEILSEVSLVHNILKPLICPFHNKIELGV